MREAALPAAAIALRTQAVNLIGQGEVEAGLEMFVDSVSLPGAWKKSTSRFRTMAIDNASTLQATARPAARLFAAHGRRHRMPHTADRRPAQPKMFRNNVDTLSQWIACATADGCRRIARDECGKPAVFNRYVHDFVAA